MTNSLYRGKRPPITLLTHAPAFERACERTATYRQRFPFGVLVQQTIERRLLPNFRAAMASAIASAR